VGGAAAALRAVSPIVTVANAAAQANRIQCCLAVIRPSPETRTRPITVQHFAQRRYPPSGIARWFSAQAAGLGD
jgi:hypothetical protein